VKMGILVLAWLHFFPHHIAHQSLLLGQMILKQL